MGTGGFVGKVKNKVGIGNRESLEKREILIRDCAKMENKLNARIENLEKGKSVRPEKGSLLDKNPENDEKFKEIIDKEAEQKKDQAVWKAYSKRGGISDTLADIKRAVEHPAANAFEFDEEEGMYIIFITINNTCISRLTDLCREMCDEYEQIDKRKMEDSGLQKEREELFKIYDNLKSRYKELNSEYEKLQETLKKLPKISKLDRSRSKNESGTDGLRQRKEDLQGLASNLGFHEKKREDYKINVDDYQKRLMFFAEECDRQRSYKPQFDTEKGLYHKLKELEEYFDENGRFYRLTVSPEGKEELEKYMDKAKEFCKWISDMMKLYPL